MWLEGGGCRIHHSFRTIYGAVPLYRCRVGWPVFLGPFLLGGFVVAHMLVRHGSVSPYGESIQSGGFNDKLYF